MKTPRKRKRRSKFDAPAAARRNLRWILKRDLDLARSNSQTVAANEARQRMYELAGVEDVTADYVIDLRLIEIDGPPMTVHGPPKFDNSLPMKHQAKAKLIPDLGGGK